MPNHTIPLSERYRPEKFSDILLGKENILLCGEAAALITPSAAEGISNALWSGKYCAEAINEGFSKQVLPIYKDKCFGVLERLKKKFDKAEIISNVSKRKTLFKQ